MKSKGHLVNKNLSFVISGTGVSSLPETWKISQNIKFCMIMRSFGQLYSLYVTVWQQTPEHFFLNLSKRSKTCKKLVCPSKKRMVVEFFSGSDETLKVANNLWFRFCWLIIFFSSEEPPATNAWVQFRVITSFKLLHRKRFYSAKFPEVTQKLAQN